MQTYSHHIPSFLREVSGLPPEHAYYVLRMMWLYIETEQPLSNDIDVLARQIGVHGKNELLEVLRKNHFFSEIRSDIRSKMDLESEKVWRHSNIDAQIEAYKAKSERAKSANSKRWEKNKDATKVVEEVKNDLNLKTNAPPIYINIKKERKKKTPRPQDEDRYKPENIPREVWENFVQLRRMKRAPITALVIGMIEAQAEEAGLSMEQVLRICIERGWASFRASWNGVKEMSKQANERHLK